MNAAATHDATGPGARDSDACPRCGTARAALTLLTSMTRYYACGSCAARWSVARNWLPVSLPPTAGVLESIADGVIGLTPSPGRRV